MNECSPEIVSHCIGVGGVEAHLICHKHGFLFASGGHNPNRTVLAFLRVWGAHVLNPTQQPEAFKLITEEDVGKSIFIPLPIECL